MPKDRVLLVTALLADAINLGLTKIAEACHGATLRTVRGETLMPSLTSRPVAMDARDAVRMLKPGLLCVSGETGRSLRIKVVPAVTCPPQKIGSHEA